MSKMRAAQQPALILCARSFLWTLLVSSFLLFFWSLFARATHWYNSDTGGQFGKLWDGLEIPLHALEKQVKNVDAPVLTGQLSAMVRVLSLLRLTASALKLMVNSLRPGTSRSSSRCSTCRKTRFAHFDLTASPECNNFDTNACPVVCLAVCLG